MWTDLLYLFIPVIVGTVVVRLLAERVLPRDTLGAQPRTLLASRQPGAPEDAARPDDGASSEDALR